MSQQLAPMTKKLSAATAAETGRLMYTLHMSWPFRALVLLILLGWGIAPELICFIPDQPSSSSQAEVDCCQKMAGECGNTQMSHQCCRPEVKTQIGVAAKIIRQSMPVSEAAKWNPDITTALHDCWKVLATTIDRPPDKPLLSPSILRI